MRGQKQRKCDTMHAAVRDLSFNMAREIRFNVRKQVLFGRTTGKSVEISLVIGDQARDGHVRFAFHALQQRVSEPARGKSELGFELFHLFVITASYSKNS